MSSTKYEKVGAVRIGRSGTKLHPAYLDMGYDGKEHLVIACSCPGTQQGGAYHKARFILGARANCRNAGPLLISSTVHVETNPEQDRAKAIAAFTAGAVPLASTTKRLPAGGVFPAGGGEEVRKLKSYLTSAEAQAMGFPTVDEQIERFNKAVRTSRAAALYQDADRRDADVFLNLRKIEIMAREFFAAGGYRASTRHAINASQGAA